MKKVGLLDMEVDLSLEVDLLIIKKGEVEIYKNGTIIQETDKALLVEFRQQGRKAWIPKSITHLTEDNVNYFSKSVTWKPNTRVTMLTMSIHK